jgi:hypothetical protein
MKDKSLHTLLGIMAFIFILFVSGGQAGVVNTTNLSDIFNAVHVPPGTTGTYSGDPLAIGYSTSSLANFPVSPGTSFGILSTGQVTDIPTSANADQLGTDLGAYGPDGDTASLTLNIPVPTWAQYVEFDFTFLSNEWPLFQFSYNDFFSAYLNGVNVALDGNGKAITVNNNYMSTTLTPTGTFFGGQTPIIHVNTAVPQGASSITLQFQIGDATDGYYDSAVFFDNIFFEPSNSYVNQYAYTTQFPDGSSYQGVVYAKNGEGYGIGWTGTMTNAQGLTGTYEITNIVPGNGSFDAEQGQVYVDSYTDGATGLVYTPIDFSHGLPSGTNYLGSEKYGGGIAQVTNNSYFDVAPKVNDNGSIVWQGYDGSDYEIYCLVPGQAVKQITNNSVADVLPEMNASGHLVWMEWDGNDWQVWYNLGNGNVQLTNNNALNVLPQITNDDQIYWQGYDGSDYEIYQYNPVTKMTTPVTNNSVADVWPQVNASGQLTWMEWTNNNWQIMYESTNGPVPVTTSGDNERPQIADNGLIVWQGANGSSNYQIYSYNIGTGVTTQITNNATNNVTPAVKNGVLVWSEWNGSYWQIYRDILSSSVVTPITDDSHNNQNPSLNNNGQIVWMKWDGSDFEIYSYK